MKWWKKIEGFENYEICYVGLVRNIKTKRILKQEKCKGYLRVSLCKDNVVKRFLVHRLVATYFLENKENKKCVNHKNGDKEFNHFLNLEWVTHSENERHSYDVLGKINSNRKLTEFDLIDIRQNCVKGKNSNVKNFSNKYCVNVTVIYNVLKNKYYVTT